MEASRPSAILPGWPRLQVALQRFSRLDDRSLAAMRVLLGCVLLLDVRRGWLLADDWLAMQAFDQWPLPVGLDDAATSLKLALGLFGFGSLAFLVGWRTRTVTPLVWVAACGYQYASRYTIDYHDAVVCQLLLWSLALPLGRAWSMDAWQGRQDRHWPGWLSLAAATGLLATIAWIYLTTFIAKDGAAWWSQGHAVRLAIADRAVMRPLGAWAVAHLPDAVFAAMTWGTLVVEAAVPLLIFSGRATARRLAAAALVVLHTGMWLLMDLGSFPLIMMAAAAAVWLPRQIVPEEPESMVPAAGRSGRRPWASGAIGLLFGLNLLLAADDERQTRWPVEPDTTMARWLRRGHTFLAAEPVWSMYAPEPWRFTGWWVAVGERMDGTLVDPITGQAPTLAAPWPDDCLLRWVYLWNPPSASGPPVAVAAGAPTAADPSISRGDEDAQVMKPVRSLGTEDAYLRFLLHRDQQQDNRLRWLALVYVYEPLDGVTRHSQVPLLSRLWPESLSSQTVAGALGSDLYRVETDSLGVAGWRPHHLASVPD